MPVPGYDDLRESISKKFRRDNNLSYNSDQIVVSTGAKQSIANVVLTLINPGDEVIIPAPFWVSYIEIVKVAGGIPIIVNAGIEKDFKITMVCRSVGRHSVYRHVGWVDVEIERHVVAVGGRAVRRGQAGGEEGKGGDCERSRKAQDHGGHRKNRRIRRTY